MAKESKKMSEPETSRLYDLWAKIYDHTFGALVHKRQAVAVEQLQCQSGERVLDLGVGTGMTLTHYPSHCTVVGMDLSPGMLGKAADKRRDGNLDHVHLVQADGMMPPFADGSFDRILITHTVSVVSEPQRLMQWAARLVKPGGRIVVLNHFQSTQPVIGKLEEVFNPLFVKIGWRSDLSLEETLDGVPLKLLYQFKLATVDVWRIVVLEKGAGEAERAEDIAVH